MAQYQSFPDAAGDSLTLDKLKTLHLPELSGKSFFDVGCNEGFFCGFAHFQGATRVLGIDQSAAYLARARKRFPACEFREQDWTSLPDERFDVILLASALHYAEDQTALIGALVERLAEDGVLVLELARNVRIDARRPGAEWQFLFDRSDPLRQLQSREVHVRIAREPHLDRGPPLLRDRRDFLDVADLLDHALERRGQERFGDLG